MNAKILIIDDVCPSPYSASSLACEKLPGGTESTVIRIATGLSKRGHLIYVQIHNAKEDTGSFSSAPCPFIPDIVIILRTTCHLEKYRKFYPQSVFYLWLHDLLGAPWKGCEALLQNTKTQLITVSGYHLQQAYTQIDQTKVQGSYIYNPIDDDLKADSTPVNPKKLIFFSNPNKGLEYTLKVFQALYQQDPSFQLFVAHPNHDPHLAKQQAPLGSGLVYLGALSYPDIIQEVRSSLCAFHLNHVYPETFGLVTAEANAVGTPVLTHPHGATPEIIEESSQLIDTWQQERVIKKILKWSLGERPHVRANPQLKLQRVLDNWEALFFLQAKR